LPLRDLEPAVHEQGLGQLRPGLGGFEHLHALPERVVGSRQVIRSLAGPIKLLRAEHRREHLDEIAKGA
jgi:hypothetical protein